MARDFLVVFGLLILAVAGVFSAAVSPSPSPRSPTTTTIKRSPSLSKIIKKVAPGNGAATPASSLVAPAPPTHSRREQEDADYEIPYELAPTGVTVVEDSMSLSPTADDPFTFKESVANPELVQSPHKSTASSSTVKFSAFVSAVAAAGAMVLFLF